MLLALCEGIWVLAHKFCLYFRVSASACALLCSADVSVFTPALQERGREGEGYCTAPALSRPDVQGGLSTAAKT